MEAKPSLVQNPFVTPIENEQTPTKTIETPKTLEDYARPVVVLRESDLKSIVYPETPRTSWMGDPRFLQKGMNCQVCLRFYPVGTLIDGSFIWCARHRAWRCSGCWPDQGSLNARAYARGERESEERWRSGRPCTCTRTVPGGPRVRAFDLSIEISGKSGSAVEFTIVNSDGLTARVRAWVPGKEVNRPEALEVIGQLGFLYDGSAHA